MATPPLAAHGLMALVGQTKGLIGEGL
jgi:hypothetical protein